MTVKDKWIYEGWRLVIADDDFFEINCRLYKLVRLNMICINRRVSIESDVVGLIYEDYGIIKIYNGNESGQVHNLDLLITKYMRTDKLDELLG